MKVKKMNLSCKGKKKIVELIRTIHSLIIHKLSVSIQLSLIQVKQIILMWVRYRVQHACLKRCMINRKSSAQILISIQYKKNEEVAKERVNLVQIKSQACVLDQTTNRILDQQVMVGLTLISHLLTYPIIEDQRCQRTRTPTINSDLAQQYPRILSIK